MNASKASSRSNGYRSLRSFSLFCFLALAFGSQSACGLSETSAQEVFSEIYTQGTWGRNAQGEGISGVGSIYENAVPYVSFLQTFINDHRIRSVIDIGCGDWELAKHIEWKNISYYGYDVVQAVIDRDTAKYGSPTRRFICADALHAKLPKADLLICKDVLQHLPNADIELFLPTLRSYRYCLITNDIAAALFPNASVNEDIATGKCRLLDLTKPPFNVKGKSVLTYVSANTTKQVLLLVHGKKARRQGRK